MKHQFEIKIKSWHFVFGYTWKQDLKKYLDSFIHRIVLILRLLLWRSKNVTRSIALLPWKLHLQRLLDTFFDYTRSLNWPLAHKKLPLVIKYVDENCTVPLVVVVVGGYVVVRVVGNVFRALVYGCKEIEWKLKINAHLVCLSLAHLVSRLSLTRLVARSSLARLVAHLSLACLVVRFNVVVVDMWCQWCHGGGMVDKWWWWWWWHCCCGWMVSRLLAKNQPPMKTSNYARFRWRLVDRLHTHLVFRAREGALPLCWQLSAWFNVTRRDKTLLATSLYLQMSCN